MKKIISALLCILLICSISVVPSYCAQVDVDETDAMLVTSATIEQAVQWAIDTANDDSHGYSQYNRWGNPDYDCASFVISAFRSVGFKLTDAVHCGNMKQPFIDEGFEWIPKSEIDLSSSKYLKRGDILLNTRSHTEIYIGDNMQVGAHEGTIDDFDLKDPGDSTGKEICPVKYTNYSNWEGILRYRAEKHIDVGDDFFAYIQNNKTKKYLTNDNRNVSVRDLTGELNQIWKFERQDDGAYIIRTCFDNKVLNVSYAGTTAGTNVGVYNNTDSPAKRWFIYGKTSKCRIKPKCADLALDAYKGTTSSKDGLNVSIQTDNGSSTQYFKIVNLDLPQSSYIDAKAQTERDPVSLWWNMTLYTDSYDVKIWEEGKSEKDTIIEFTDLVETYCQVELPAGKYEAVVYSKNKVASTVSLNTVKFTVEEDPYKIGDTDLDGELSVMDATAIQLHLAQIVSLNELGLSLADTDNDSSVSVMDATQIQLFLAQIIPEL